MDQPWSVMWKSHSSKWETTQYKCANRMLPSHHLSASTPPRPGILSHRKARIPSPVRGYGCPSLPAMVWSLWFGARCFTIPVPYTYYQDDRDDCACGLCRLPEGCGDGVYALGRDPIRCRLPSGDLGWCSYYPRRRADPDTRGWVLNGLIARAG